MESPVRGIHHDIPIDDYHRFSDTISNSGLQLLAKSPWHLQQGFAPKTKSMEKGDLFHTLLLEPEKFNERFMIGPEVNKNTKIWKSFAAENHGYQLIKPSETVNQQRMVSNLEVLSRDLRDTTGEPLDLLQISRDVGKFEVSVFTEIDGIGVRVRPDILIAFDEAAIVVDVKTTKSPDIEGFRREIANYNYHEQAALYADAVQQETGVDDVMSAFMVIGNSYPFPAAIYQASTAMINVGRDGYKRNLKRYKECLDKNEWPQLNDGNIAVVELPKYMIGV